MDLRDAFFDSLYNSIKDDDNFYFLTADMWAFSLQKFKDKLNDRFINVGIAEQNMISVAAGLAQEGKKVCVYTITPFVTERCFEQIKVDLCCMNLPVMIVGIGSGLTYSYDGPTHHTPYDISLMRSLPNLSIYSPSTPLVNKYVAEIAYRNEGPSYIRLDKGNFEDIYDSIPSQQSIGILGPLEPESDLAIMTTGSIIYEVIKMIPFLNQDKGINTTLTDIYQIKPLDEGRLVKIISGHKRVVVIEEHSSIGGLGSIVSEVMIDHKLYKPLMKISLPDEFCKKYGDRNWIRAEYGLDSSSIMNKIICTENDISEQ